MIDKEKNSAPSKTNEDAKPKKTKTVNTENDKIGSKAKVKPSAKKNSSTDSSTTNAAGGILTEKIKELEGVIKKLEEEKNKIMMLAAEKENIIKRKDKEIEDTKKFSISKFAEDTVEIVENLYRASSCIPKDINSETDINNLINNVRVGMEMAIKSSTEVLSKSNIERIYPLGEPVDFNFHMVTSQIESPNHPDDTVVQVVQAGYKLNNRILKPAMVIVSKKTGK